MKIITLRALNRLATADSLELPVKVVLKGQVLFEAHAEGSISGDAIPRASTLSEEKEEEPADDYAEKFKTDEGKIENTPSWAANLVGDLDEKVPDEKGWLPTGRCEMPFCKQDAVAMAKKYNTETGEENDIAVCKRHYSLYLKEQGK